MYRKQRLDALDFLATVIAHLLVPDKLKLSVLKAKLPHHAQCMRKVPTDAIADDACFQLHKLFVLWEVCELAVKLSTDDVLDNAGNNPVVAIREFRFSCVK